MNLFGWVLFLALEIWLVEYASSSSCQNLDSTSFADCVQAGYNVTEVYNPRNTSQKELSRLIASMRSKFNNCSSLSSLMTCSVQLPKCPTAASTLPCKDVCRNFVSECQNSSSESDGLVALFRGICELLPSDECLSTPNNLNNSASEAVKCRRLTITQCQDAGYSFTSVSDAYQQMVESSAIFQDSDANSTLRKVICMEIAPPCDAKKNQTLIVPCRSMCDDAFNESQSEFVKVFKAQKYCSTFPEFPDNATVDGKEYCTLKAWPDNGYWPSGLWAFLNTEQKTTPPTMADKTTPVSAVYATTPAPTASATTPAPTVNATTPVSTTSATTPAPTTSPTTPAPTVNATTPAPTSNAYKPLPTTIVTALVNVTTTKVTTPTATTNVATPASKANATTPASTTNVTMPAPSTKGTTPASTTNVTTPASSTKETMPTSTTIVTTPASKANATTPVSTPNVTTPAPSTKGTTPSSTPNVTTPASSTKETTPTSTTNLTTSASKTIVTTPAPTTSVATPAPTTKRTSPTSTTNVTTPASRANETTPAPTTKRTSPTSRANGTKPAFSTKGTAPATSTKGGKPTPTTYKSSTSSSSTSGMKGSTPDVSASKGGKMSAGAIAGTVLGILVLLLAIVLGAICFRKYHRTKRQYQHSLMVDMDEL